MKSVKSIIFISSLVLAGAFALVLKPSFVGISAPHQANPQESIRSKESVSKGKTDGKILFTIPVGEKGLLQYEGEHVEEQETWGPAALRIAPDGTFLIVDPVSNSVLQFNAQGELVNKIKVDAVGITDVASDGTSLFVFDESAVIPTIFRLSSTGEVLDRVELSQEWRNEGLSGITLKASGEIDAELQGGTSYKSIGDKIALKANRIEADRYVETQSATVHIENKNNGTLSIPGKAPIFINVAHSLGTLKLLAENRNGDFYVLVDEISETSEIKVDQTIRHFSSNGEYLGSARVPLAEMYTYVKHDLTVAPDGTVYALMTRPDRVEVLRLDFSKNLKSILPENDEIKESSGIDGAASNYTAVACRSRQDMASVAKAYVNNSLYLNNTNVNGSCSGRSRPAYLNLGATVYSSVAYNWGGFDSVYEYNWYMLNNKQAGNMNTAATPSCAKGVDCSGFVSQCWGLTQRYYTGSLPSLCTEITTDWQSLRTGDILNKTGEDAHVVMIDSVNNGGAYVWESTHNYNADRVVYGFTSWDRVGIAKGYKKLRYKSVC